MQLDSTLNQIKEKKCIIEIFGLGYVGFPLAIRLSSSGFKIRGIDINSKRLERLQNSILTESELNLKQEFIHLRNVNRFDLSTDSIKTDTSKVGIFCVPTPIPQNQVNSNVFVNSAVENFLQVSKPGDVVILESSIEIGTTEKTKKLIESKGYKVGKDFGLCFCPERIDPQNKKWNLENIPRVIYSSDDTTHQIAQQIYRHVNNSHLIRVVSPKIAEIVKSYENAFRLVNISLVNELALLCEKLNVNVKDVINAASTKPFGFMPFYSGAGAGGHCIPKDPLFLLNSAKKFGINFDTIETALSINSIMPKHIAESIEKIGEKEQFKKTILVVGLTYKPDIEDMRDSPGFRVIQELSNRKFEITISDPYYKKELREKYLIENNLEDFDFKELEDFTDDDEIKKFDCLCIVQHHAQSKSRINEIYAKSLVPFIYDCSNKLIKNQQSKTSLKLLGS